MAKTTMICPMSSLVGVMRASARTRISLCGHGPRFGDRASKRQSLSRDSRGLSGDNRAFFIRRRPGRHYMRSEEHTSELQSLMRISYAVFCLKKKKPKYQCVTLRILKAKKHDGKGTKPRNAITGTKTL